MLRKTRIASRV